MELDHIFMFVEPDGIELDSLRSIGLIETYRRRHSGQGTENVCFCFDNIFLECVWVNDIGEITSDVIARTALYQRSRWRTLGTSPFGLGWREQAPGAPSGMATWPFAPPYLPAGMTIDVAVESDDPRQPMMFRSPGSLPPLQWPDSRRGSLQHRAGFGRVLSATLHWPRHARPGPGLAMLASATILDTAPTDADTSSICLLIERDGSRTPLQITLPVSPAG